MCRTSFHVCYYGSPHQGGPYQSLTGSCLLLYHLFHSLLCTIDVPMYTAGESVFYRRSDGSLVPATVLGPGAQSETVQIEYKRNERLVRHPAALIANLSRVTNVWISSGQRQPGVSGAWHMCSTTSCFSQGTSWMMMQSPCILTSQTPSLSLSLSRSQLQRRL